MPYIMLIFNEKPIINELGTCRYWTETNQIKHLVPSGEIVLRFCAMCISILQFSPNEKLWYALISIYVWSMYLLRIGVIQMILKMTSVSHGLGTKELIWCA